MSRILDAKRDMDTIKGLRSEIARLQEQVETLGARLAAAYRRKAECNDDANAERHLRLAAEAERDRLREAGNNLIRFFDSTGLDTNFLGELRAALQKEPQP